jgi:hypothetical protein
MGNKVSFSWKQYFQKQAMGDSARMSENNMGLLGTKEYPAPLAIKLKVQIKITSLHKISYFYI